MSPSEGDYIVSMSLSPSEETVICATASQQLLIHTLSSSDLTKVYTLSPSLSPSPSPSPSLFTPSLPPSLFPYTCKVGIVIWRANFNYHLCIHINVLLMDIIIHVHVHLMSYTGSLQLCI